MIPEAMEKTQQTARAEYLAISFLVAFIILVAPCDSAREDSHIA